MDFSSIRPKCVITVIVFQFLEVYSHNVPNTDPNMSNFQVESKTVGDYPDPKLRVIEYSDLPNGYDPPSSPNFDQTSLDTWSVIWYIASFGGLILFFLIVSCSEWCCRRNARANCQRASTTQTASPIAPDTPPPSYDHFAPPAYEDLWVGSSRGSAGEKSEYDIYVVPVHALGTIMEDVRREEAPPPYLSASVGMAHPSELPGVHSSNASSSIT